MKNLKSKKGITLTALVVTIIIMAILATVTITSTNIGKDFRKYNQMLADVELLEDKVLYFYREYGELPIGAEVTDIPTQISNGHAFYEINMNKIGGITLNLGSAEDIYIVDSVTMQVYYKNGIEYEGVIYYTDKEEEINNEENPNEEENTNLPYEQTAKDANGMLIANATYKSGKYTAVIPKGFAVSNVKTEQAIETGLVIKDINNNEFVWIPVTEELEIFYDYDANGKESGYYEPKELEGGETKYDSQDILNKLYPTNYYTFTKGMYASEYAQMTEKVNEYKGFYIGRYETTIDSEGKIGSKYNTPVLTAGATFTYNSTQYNYCWYGLYNEQKKADVSGNGSSVQTAMIYGVLWDKTMDFIRIQKTAGNTEYDVDTLNPNWHQVGSHIFNSAQANYLGNGDVALNIWDLESNAIEWTQEAYDCDRRIVRGGAYNNTLPASAHSSGYPRALPNYNDGINSSRLVLYIKR